MALRSLHSSEGKPGRKLAAPRPALGSAETRSRRRLWHCDGLRQGQGGPEETAGEAEVHRRAGAGLGRARAAAEEIGFGEAPGRGAAGQRGDAAGVAFGGGRRRGTAPSARDRRLGAEEAAAGRGRAGCGRRGSEAADSGRARAETAAVD